MVYYTWTLWTGLIVHFKVIHVNENFSIMRVSQLFCLIDF